MQSKQVRADLHGWDHLPMPSSRSRSSPSSREPADFGVLLWMVLEGPPARLLWVQQLPTAWGAPVPRLHPLVSLGFPQIHRFPTRTDEPD